MGGREGAYADPVSKITSYATGGVPTAMEPKKLL